MATENSIQKKNKKAPTLLTKLIQLLRGKNFSAPKSPNEEYYKGGFFV